MAHEIEALSESERTKEIDEPQKKNNNKITCREYVIQMILSCFPTCLKVVDSWLTAFDWFYRSSVNSQLKEIDLFQISNAMDGDVIILTLTLPRTVPRTVSFGANIKLLVGFCIFVLEIFYGLVHHEPMNQEKRALLNLMLFTGSLIFILLIEISQLFSHRLTLEERRLVRLVGWLQEALICIVFVTIVYWTPMVPPMTIATLERSQLSARVDAAPVNVCFRAAQSLACSLVHYGFSASVLWEKNVCWMPQQLRGAR